MYEFSIYLAWLILPKFMKTQQTSAVNQAICLQTEEILAPNYFCGEIKLLLFKVIKVKLTVILC
jgi:hypothetical protein